MSTLSVRMTTTVTPIHFDVSLMNSIYNDKPFGDIVALIETRPELIRNSFLDGTTPLHWAVVNDRADLIQYLLPRVSDPFARALKDCNYGALNPLELAIQTQSAEIVGAYLAWCGNNPEFIPALKKAKEYADKRNNPEQSRQIEQHLASLTPPP